VTDVLLPHTDAGALAQLIGAAVVFAAAVVAARRHSEVLVFVAGLAVFTFALLALRTLH
jgi:hypothetical protein